MVRREWKESHNDQEWADIQKFGPEAMGNVFFDPHGPKPNGRDACFDALVRHRRAWGNLSDSEKLKAQCLDLDGVSNLLFLYVYPDSVNMVIY